jgi:O-antigen ligase
VIKYILIGYIFLFIHRPFEVWPVLQTVRLERVYVLMAAAAVLLIGNKRWISNASNIAIGCFTVAMTLSVLLSPWREVSQVSLEEYLKLLFFFVLIVLSIHSKDDLRTIVLGYLGVMFIYMGHSLREYKNGRHEFKMGIPRMIGVDITLGDANSFGASIAYSLPFLVPFWLDRPTRRMRAFVVGYLALSGVCVALTGSRSAMVGIMVFLSSLFLRAKHRVRFALLAAALLPFCWLLLPESYQKRFQTIFVRDPTAAGYHSAEQRTEGFWTGVELFQQYPVTGCGLGAWRPATGQPMESHNLYGQVLGETGILGTASFALLVATILLNVRWVRKTYMVRPEWERDFLYHLAGAIGLAVFLLLVVGWGAHSLIRYNWLWLSAFALIARDCVRQRAARSIPTRHQIAQAK